MSVVDCTGSPRELLLPAEDFEDEILKFLYVRYKCDPDGGSNKKEAIVKEGELRVYIVDASTILFKGVGGGGYHARRQN